MVCKKIILRIVECTIHANEIGNTISKVRFERQIDLPVDDRTEPKIPKFRCFGNFGSVRFGSVRLKNTEPKQIEEFRFNNKLKLHIGSEICKKFSSKSVHGIIQYKFFFVKLNTNEFSPQNLPKRSMILPKINVFEKLSFGSVVSVSVRQT